MSTPIQRRLATFCLGFAVAAAATGAALAQKKYDTGASDTEIKIGNIVPYSGPASAYGVIGKSEAAVFKKVNDEGGINGRKINFISYDDAYSPPKAVEQARKLVESDEVLLLFGTSARPPTPRSRNTSTARRCRNCSSPPAPPSGTIPKNFPWTMGWQPNYQSESADLREVHAKEQAERPRSRCSIRTTTTARTI